ncbi:MAG: plasmid pRiA4b ORF-3 family protein [Oxalobacter sp.]|nr:plasmid pRiA4b ORF-3 family protein [Oxalobacter sp.]
MNQYLYSFKINLSGIKPEIWRRFLVPSDITLETFHHVIQAVMGWENCHLYEFSIAEKTYMTDPEKEKNDLDPANYRLMDLGLQTGQTFRYCYDFGDDWNHELLLEEDTYIPADHIARTARCIEGARACPPEDVGGIPGYEDFCEAMADPGHENHRELKRWYSGTFGGKFDSEKFDLTEINSKLAAIPV